MNELKRNKKIVVMFTGGGGSGTIYILKNLKKYGIYKTVAVDSNPYAAGLYIADKGYKVPLCIDDRYLDSILEIIRRENVEVIVPLIDEELIKIFDLERDFLDLKIILPNKKFVDMTIDKLKTSKELLKADIPCPDTYTIEEFQKINSQFPAIIKPIDGRGSRGFQRLYSHKDINSYLEHIAYKENKLIIQKDIKGKEFTTSVVVKKEGTILSIVPKEVISKVGITKIAVTRNNPHIINSCREIQETFKANGPFNVQQILEDRTNIPYVIEINPRFSTTVSLTIEAGIDEVDLLIKDRLGLQLPPIKPFKENLLMIRYEDQVVISEDGMVGK